MANSKERAESRDNSASGFVVFCDVEGYTKREDEHDIAAITISLCEAARAAADIAGLKNVVFQCTGDGFVAAPVGARAPAIIKFLEQTIKEFNPEKHGGTPESGAVRIRWGIDYGTYQLVRTFGSRNIAGHAAIGAARIGSLGDGGHVLVSDVAYSKLKEHADFADLGMVAFKHGYSRQVFLRKFSDTTEPSALHRRRSAISCAEPFLRRFALVLLKAVPVKAQGLNRKDEGDGIANQLKLRASLLLPNSDGSQLRVPEHHKKHRALFRATFGNHRAGARGPGVTAYPISVPKGVPALAYRVGLAQAMINLPPGTDRGYTDAVLAPANDMFNLERSDIEQWSRKAQNFVAIPVPARHAQINSDGDSRRSSAPPNLATPAARHRFEPASGGAFGVVAIDFDGQIGMSRNALIAKIGNLLTSNSSLALEFKALELLTARIVGA